MPVDKKLVVGSQVNIVMAPGQVRPAVCVRVWANEGGNFQVFIDGSNDRTFASEAEQAKGLMWLTSVCKSEEKATRTWHWPE